MTYLTMSSETNSQKVLSFQEVVTLVKVLRQIHEHFIKIYRSEPFGMDVEFKFMGEKRELSVKQARPYPFGN